jgi:hypothetical protein
MAWNPSPEVAVARDAAKKLGAKQAIIIYFTDTQIGMASYGATKELCREAGRLGNRLYEMVTAEIHDDAAEAEANVGIFYSDPCPKCGVNHITCDGAAAEIKKSWDACHELMKCDHPRACWQDRNYPASEQNYNPKTKSSDPQIDYRCVACEQFDALFQVVFPGAPVPIATKAQMEMLVAHIRNREQLVALAIEASSRWNRNGLIGWNQAASKMVQLVNAMDLDHS